MRTCNILLFEDFEILDAMGPVEMLARTPGGAFSVCCVSAEGGPVRSLQGPAVDTLPFSQMNRGGDLLIPGGSGHRPLLHNAAYLDTLRALVEDAPRVLTVCTGAVLLAATGALDGRNATSNKQLFSWAEETRPAVHWKRKARWVVDGKFHTASGVSAGMDMALDYIAGLLSIEAAEQTATFTEYVWNRDAENDPFEAI